MSKETLPLGWEIIGNPDGNTNMSKEEYQELKAVIDRHIANTPPEQKRESEHFAIMIQMDAYTRKNTKTEILEIGHFIKKILAIYNLPQKKLADYLGLNKSNFSALMNGNRKINYDIALKLAYIFGIKAELWLAIQNKNELWKLETANKKEYEKYSLKGLMAA